LTEYLHKGQDEKAYCFDRYCRDITGRLTMQTSLGLPEDPII